jgi:hypothetical protein
MCKSKLKINGFGGVMVSSMLWSHALTNPKAAQFIFSASLLSSIKKEEQRLLRLKSE